MNNRHGAPAPGEEFVPLNFDKLQNLEKKVREAESLIRNLREENQGLSEQLERFRSGGVHWEDDSRPDDAAVDLQVLLDQRSRIRSSIHRMLNLLDRIEH